MNELETQLSKVLQKAIEIAEQTGEFAIEQAPLLLQEFYMWHIAKNCLGILLGLLFLFIGFKIFKILGKKEPFKEYGSEVPKICGRYYSMDARFGSGFGSGLCFICSIVIASINIYNLIFILIAPKLYLIEYFIK